MKTKPILFSAPMVQAILDGRKTQTRRVIKPQPTQVGSIWRLDKKQSSNRPFNEWHNHPFGIQSPYGSKGDILWVRETWGLDYFGQTQFYHLKDKRITPKEKDFLYKATKGELDELLENKWKPSIHMPKAAARIFLEITNVRVERLQDISKDNAKSEGIHWCTEDNGREEDFYIYPPKDKKRGIYGGPCRIDGTWVSESTAFFNDKPWWHSFRTLWQSINGEQSWNANPWVWVVEFK